LLYTLHKLESKNLGGKCADNLRAAGHLDGGVLTLRLIADVGTWHPQGPRGPALNVAAFGEESRELAAPGSLIRAREGTAVIVSSYRPWNAVARIPPRQRGVAASGAAGDSLALRRELTRNRDSP
jgi:hypothetical protein